MHSLTLVLAAAALGFVQYTPHSDLVPAVNGSTSVHAARGIDDGFVIVRTQAYFRLNGRLMIITDGIPPKFFQSDASYAQYIREGVQYHFPGAGPVTYNTDAHGNAVARDMAVTDRQYSTTTFRPAPKPKK